MSNAPTLSVALTTFNGERFLRQQLDSVLAQSRAPTELVVSDDRSTDATWDILTQFAASAPFPVRLHRNEVRLGWRQNFMHVMSMCRSDLIALCDQDDVWHPDKLQAAAAALGEPDVVLFFHNAWVVDQAGVRVGPADIFTLPRHNPPLSAYSFFSPYGFSLVFDRALLQFSDLWERSTNSNNRAERAPHDQWLFFLATVFGSIVYSDLELTDYRQHGNNAVGQPVAARMPRNRADWDYWLTNPRTGYERLAGAARDREAILSQAARRLDGTWRERAVEGARRCGALAAQLDRRAATYAVKGVVGRARNLLALYRQGAYRDEGGWGFGRSALLKDMVLGVGLKSLLR